MSKANYSYYRLKKDITIPAGSIFSCIDGRRSEYIDGNFETVIGLTKDTAGQLIYGIDENDPNIHEYFERIEE